MDEATANPIDLAHAVERGLEMRFRLREDECCWSWELTLPDGAMVARSADGFLEQSDAQADAVSFAREVGAAAERLTAVQLAPSRSTGEARS